MRCRAAVRGRRRATRRGALKSYDQARAALTKVADRMLSSSFLEKPPKVDQQVDEFEGKAMDFHSRASLLEGG